MPLKKLMGYFDADVRHRKGLEKASQKLVAKNYQHEDRMLAIEQLAEENSPECTGWLFRRWDISSMKEREDLAEKEYLAQVLIDKGEAMLPQLRQHMDRSTNVSWPIRVLRRVVDEEGVVDELLRVLGVEQQRVAAFKPEKKVRLIQLLGDYPDNPRVWDGLLPSLQDFDEQVRFETAQQLAKGCDERAVDPILDRLNSPEEDSARVKQALLACFAERGWSVKARRAAVEPHLGTAFELAPGGIVRRCGVV